LRVGTGFDIHRLVPGRPLILGGVEVPCAKGLLGHSDGDVLLHALADALLGAAALGDIGELFPDSDPATEGMDSRQIIRRVREMLAQRKLQIGNVDATLIAEQPRLSAHKAAIRHSVAEALGLPTDAVGLKAKTMEQLGPIGRGEAIAAQAVALLRDCT